MMPYRYIVAIYCTLILLCCTSCSLTSSSAKANTQYLDSTVAGYSLTEIQSSPHVYQIDFNDPNKNKYFLTSIEDCSDSDYKSLGTASRRLLVGLEDVRILELGSVPIGDHSATRSRSSANYDGILIDLVSYTVEDRGCIKDLAVWTNAGDSILGEEFERRGEIFESLEQNLVLSIIDS